MTAQINTEEKRKEIREEKLEKKDKQKMTQINTKEKRKKIRQEK